MITKFGKRFLTSYIAGNSDFISKDLAFGIATASQLPVADTNTRLGFEFYRLPVNLSSISVEDDGVGGYNYYAIYKATIPQGISGVICEVGLYPGLRQSLNGYDSKFITAFENNITWVDSLNDSPALESNSPDGTTFVSKIGENMIKFEVDQSTSKEYKNSIVLLDLSGYSVNDSLTLAYKKADSNTSKIRIKFYSSATSYYYADFTPSGSNEDKVESISMSDIFNNIVGSPDLTNITQIGVEVTAGSGGDTTVYFDGLRINDEDTFDPQYGLIARSILTTPLKKPSGRPVDIEYKLQLEF
jgi:hypothetical protein